jgi:hypothetical protein
LERLEADRVGEEYMANLCHQNPNNGGLDFFVFDK